MIWPWYELNCMNLFGWWPHACKTQKWHNISNVGGKVLYWVLVVLFVPEFISLYKTVTTGSMYDIIISLVTINMGIECFAKLSLFILKRKGIKYITDTLNEMDTRARNVLDPEDFEEVYRSHFLLCQSTKLYMIVACTVTVQWVLTPVVYLAYGKTEFLMESTYPWSADTTVGWILTYILQMVHLSTAIFALCIFDNVSYVILILVDLQMEYLMLALQKVDYSRQDPSVPTLKFCVRFHIDILKLCDEINNFVAVPILLQVMLATIVICICIFLFMSAEKHDIRTFNMMELAICQVFELFAYCWLCQRIEGQNVRIMRAANHSNWYMISVGEGRSLSILLEISKRPINFGLLVQANLQTFVTVMQSAFSYYNFLTAVTEESS